MKIIPPNRVVREPELGPVTNSNALTFEVRDGRLLRIASHVPGAAVSQEQGIHARAAFGAIRAAAQVQNGREVARADGHEREAQYTGMTTAGVTLESPVAIGAHQVLDGRAADSTLEG